MYYASLRETDLSFLSWHSKGLSVEHELQLREP